MISMTGSAQPHHQPPLYECANILSFPAHLGLVIFSRLTFKLLRERPVRNGSVPRCASVASESMIKALSVDECGRQLECHAAPRHCSVSNWPWCMAFQPCINTVLKSFFPQRERHFESDNKIRTSMLVTSITQGVLAGYAINSYYLSSQPLACVTPAVVSVGYTVSLAFLPSPAAGLVISQLFQISVRQSHGNRFQMLGFSLGAAFIVNLVLGAMFGTNTLSYQFLTLGYVAIAGFMMQLVLHDVQMVKRIYFVYDKETDFLIFRPEATPTRTLLPPCISYSKERPSTASELTSNEA
ncbi:hypothetical protein Y032_0080g1349 [Ancylostoma ceylanicum]|uniref:Uncharacterized protein n=1 Tax=Ancylostoma ceylanicum TaxID=53326 RepID=A0A016TRU3_9BILA|nr:hypothetical protein Y032_0080g1349 [Ancylostoma ceylanicum]